MAAPRSQPGDPLTERQREAWDAYQRLNSIRLVADEMGLNFSATQDHIRRARFKLGVPAGVVAAAKASGLDLAAMTHGWIKAKGEDGEPDVSAFFRTPREAETTAVERIRAAFEDMTPAPVGAAPVHASADLLTLYPLADVHLGQLSWGRETGDDYNLEIASRQLRQIMADMIVGSPESDTAIILNTGDFFHSQDDEARTPASKHALDVDGRIFKVLEAGVVLTADLIDAALKKHRRVVYRALRGNHDTVAHMTLTIALAQRYRGSDRVVIDESPADFFVMEWGRCLLAAHHGDKAKPEQMALWLAEHDLWKPRQFRHLFAGHLHHDAAKDIGGVRFERLRAFTAKDAYAAGNAYAARRSVQAITFCKRAGEIGRVKRHLP